MAKTYGHPDLLMVETYGPTSGLGQIGHRVALSAIQVDIKEERSDTRPTLLHRRTNP